MEIVLSTAASRVSASLWKNPATPGLNLVKLKASRIVCYALQPLTRVLILKIPESLSPGAGGQLQLYCPLFQNIPQWMANTTVSACLPFVSDD